MDLLGEGVQDLAGATEAANAYLSAVAAIAEKGIDATVSLKLSQLGLILDPAACTSNLAMILDRAHELGVGVEVDMEQSELVDASLTVFRKPRSSTRRPVWPFRRTCAGRRPTWTPWWP